MIKKRFRQAAVIFVSGLIVGYTAYFLILQNLAFSSAARLGLTFLTVLVSAVILFLLRDSFPPNRQTIFGILALWVLANLAAVVRVDLNNLPYTITLLPYQQFTLRPGGGEEPVRISRFSTELYQNLNLDQFKESPGWEFSQQGELVQLAGTAEDLVWYGKPGEFIRFDFVRCQGCSPVTVTDQNGRVWEVDLQAEPEGKYVSFTVEADDLTAHRVGNFAAFEGALLILTGTLMVAAARLNSPVGRGSAAGKEYDDPPWSGRYFPAVILVVFPVLLFAFKIEPVIFNDDWCQLILPMNENTFDFFILDSRRPMHLSLGWVFYQFFSLRQTVYAMQIAHLVLLALIGIVAYYLLEEILYGAHRMALLGALLLMVYPSDYTHFYLSILGIRLAYLLTLLGMYLHVRHLRSKKVICVWLASGLFVFSLLMYEAQLGLIFIWPVVVFTLLKKRDWSAELPGTLIYYASLVVFFLWRTMIHPIFYQDIKFSYLDIQLPGLLNAYMLGLKTILGGFQLPYRDPGWITVENILILAAVCVVLVLVYLGLRRMGRSAEPSEDPGQGMRNDARIFTAGLVLWAAGYFPIILNYPPNIWGHLSRVNIFTILGVVMIISALVNLVLLNITKDQSRGADWFSLVMVMLILFASVVQVQVQESYAYTWGQTKTFYQKLMQEIPQIKDGSKVLIYLSGSDGQVTAHRPIFTSEWEPYCAVQVLYGQPNIRVPVRYETLKVPEFPGVNVIGGALLENESGPLSATKNFLGVQYDLSTQELIIMDEIDPLTGEELGEEYHPEGIILPLDEEIAARELVE